MRHLCVLATFALSLLVVPAAVWADPLPGTQPLTIETPLDEVMVAGIDKFALREIAEGVAKRAEFWKRDFSSPEAYEKSIAPNRDRLKVILGAVDPRPAAAGFRFLRTSLADDLVGAGPGYTIHSVSWPALEGVTGEGLLLQPEGELKARVVVLPDADWTPEEFAELIPGSAVKSQLVRRLAQAGCQVLVPVLINRDDAYSGHPDVRFTNQPHREFIYRQAFEMGRHVIGYEVQKVLAALDQFTLLNRKQKEVPLGVAGVGEGGLLALYSAAIDTRIQAVLVADYFGPREGVWEEPIYRNVWALLREFGDAELATLVQPRGLLIQANAVSAVPQVAGPPAVKPGRSGGAAPGRIQTPAIEAVKKEYQRFESLMQGKARNAGLTIHESSQTPEALGVSSMLGLLNLLGTPQTVVPKELPAGPRSLLKDFDPNARQKRQLEELVEFTQKLLRRGARVRDGLWSRASRKSLEDWEKTAEEYRNMVYDELIGRLPKSEMPLNPRTRKVLDEPGYIGYEVVLDVYPDVIAGGILLLPKDLKAGEKRPVIVCQHGLEGVPIDTISKTVDGFKYYSAFTAELANRGFITYAPQNPYRGQDRFRTLQRKSNPMKRSLFSYIIPQHERTIEFLKTLPNTDPSRIAFYGLSYGGKTAVRVPPMVKDYCLSICSADFNEWVLKNTTVYDGYSYVFTGEYEIFEWNMGHTANYAELSYLMTPRPFMVERGHDDGVAPDEWVAWEYSKVRRHYVKLGLGDKTEIEFFNGPHKINGVQTYEFLHKHLHWPKK